MAEESDEDMSDTEGVGTKVEEEEEDEIIESDIEIEGETVEPDIDPPQKVPLSFFLEHNPRLLTFLSHFMIPPGPLNEFDWMILSDGRSIY